MGRIVINGRFEIDRELGHAVAGTVYLAHDKERDGPVALRVLHPDLAGQEPLALLQGYVDQVQSARDHCLALPREALRIDSVAGLTPGAPSSTSENRTSKVEAAATTRPLAAPPTGIFDPAQLASATTTNQLGSSTQVDPDASPVPAPSSEQERARRLWSAASGLTLVVEDYVQGVDLARSAAVLSVEDLVETALDSLRGLEVLHRCGLLHGGVRPSHVMIPDRPDSSSQPRGVLVGSGPMLPLAHALGIARARTSAEFLAPEVLGALHPDPRADLYALGAVFFRVIAGRAAAPVGLPNDAGPDPAAEVIAPFGQWLARLLAAEPHRRFQSAEEAAADLVRQAKLPKTSWQPIRTPPICGLPPCGRRPLEPTLCGRSSVLEDLLRTLGVLTTDSWSTSDSVLPEPCDAVAVLGPSGCGTDRLLDEMATKLSRTSVDVVDVRVSSPSVLPNGDPLTAPLEPLLAVSECLSSIAAGRESSRCSALTQEVSHLNQLIGGQERPGALPAGPGLDTLEVLQQRLETLIIEVASSRAVDFRNDATDANDHESPLPIHELDTLSARSSSLSEARRAAIRLANHVTALNRERPLIVIIRDAGELTPAGLAFCRHVVSEVRNNRRQTQSAAVSLFPPLVLSLSEEYRADVLEPLRESGTVRDLHIAPLDSPDSQRLRRSMRASDRSRPPLASYDAGLPLGLVLSEQLASEATAQARDLKLPEPLTLDDLVRARLEFLESTPATGPGTRGSEQLQLSVRQILSTLARLGGQTSLKRLSSELQLAPAQLTSTLIALEARLLVRLALDTGHITVGLPQSSLRRGILRTWQEQGHSQPPEAAKLASQILDYALTHLATGEPGLADASLAHCWSLVSSQEPAASARDLEADDSSNLGELESLTALAQAVLAMTQDRPSQVAIWVKRLAKSQPQVRACADLLSLLNDGNRSPPSASALRGLLKSTAQGRSRGLTAVMEGLLASAPTHDDNTSLEEVVAATRAAATSLQKTGFHAAAARILRATALRHITRSPHEIEALVSQATETANHATAILEETQALRTAALLARLQGRTAAAVEAAQSAAEQAHLAGAPALAVAAAIDAARALAESLVGRNEAIACLGRAAEEAASLGRPDLAALADLETAEIFRQDGWLDEAHAFAQRASESVAKFSAPILEAEALAMEAGVLLDQGQVDLARQLLDKAQARLGNVSAGSARTRALARIWLETGVLANSQDGAEAQDEAPRAWTQGLALLGLRPTSLQESKSSSRPPKLWLLPEQQRLAIKLAASLGEFQARRHRSTPARETAGLLKQIATASWATQANALFARIEGLVLLSDGDLARSHTLLKRSVTLLERSPILDSSEIAHGNRLLGEVLLARDDRDGAQQALRRASAFYIERARFGGRAHELEEIQVLRRQARDSNDPPSQAQLGKTLESLAKRGSPEQRRSAPAKMPDPAEIEPEAEGPRTSATRIVAENRRLREAIEIAATLLSPGEAHGLWERLLDEAVAETGAERGFLILRDPAGRLTFEATRNFDRENILRPERKVSTSIARRVIETGIAICSPDALKDARFESTSSVMDLDLRSVLAVPLAVRAEVLGCLYLDHRSDLARFDDSDQAALETLAQVAAIALFTMRLQEQNKNQGAEIEGLLDELSRDHTMRDGSSVRIRGLGHSTSVEKAMALPANQVPGLQAGPIRIVGRSSAMVAIYDLISRVARSDLPVLISGESGTGKELAARAIHHLSERRNGPFVSENCAALPETLLESELFGYVRGAFTGTQKDKAGLFQLASSGSLFLDEVGDMSPAMQTKILRVLQEHAVRPIGAKQEIRIDTRIIAATNRNLRELVANGAFREDLYFRLNVVEIPLPPLRERLDDLPDLVDDILERIALEVGTRYRARADALTELSRHSWPGNVRELENRLRTACLFARGEALGADAVRSRQDTRSSARGPGAPSLKMGSKAPMTLEELNAAQDHQERQLIEDALESHDGNKAAAARSLGITRYALYRLLKRLGMDY